MVIPLLIIVTQIINFILVIAYPDYSLWHLIVKLLLGITMIRLFAEATLSKEQKERSVLWRNWRFISVFDNVPRILSYTIVISLLLILTGLSIAYASPLPDYVLTTLLIIGLQLKRDFVD